MHMEAGDTSLKQLGGVQGEVGGAPRALAAPIHIDLLVSVVVFAIEVWPVYYIRLLHDAACKIV